RKTAPHMDQVGPPICRHLFYHTRKYPPLLWHHRKREGTFICKHHIFPMVVYMLLTVCQPLFHVCCSKGKTNLHWLVTCFNLPQSSSYCSCGNIRKPRTHSHLDISRSENLRILEDFFDLMISFGGIIQVSQ